MANWYINSVAYAAVAQWAASHTYAAGAIVRQLATPVAGEERCFRTTAGGVSGSTEPLWNTAQGGVTIADNTVTDWTEVTGNQTYQAAGAWAAPLARVPQAGLNFAGFPNAVGTGWAVNDLATMNGGTFTKAGIVKITGVTSGHPTSWVVYDTGVYSVVPPTGTTVTAISPSTGSGATVGGTNGMGSTHGAVGDNFFVSSNHAETQAVTHTIALPGTLAAPSLVICVDESGSGAVPPTSANLKTTATISNTAVAIIWIGSFHSYGMSFISSTTATNSFGFCGTAGLDEHQIIEQGSISVLNASLGIGILVIGAKLTNVVVGTGGKLEWINVSYYTSSTAGLISVRGANFSWRNNATVGLKAGSSVPTTLISPQSLVNSLAGATIELDGIDLSAMTSGNIIIGASDLPYPTILRNCKTGGAGICGTPTAPSCEVFNYNSDSANTNYRSEKYTYRGVETTNVSVTRVGGASDGVTPQSRQITTTTNVSFAAPFRSMPMMIWNDLVGSTRNFTLFGTITAGSPPANNELWLEVEYFEDASSPMASFVNNAMLLLGTPAAQTADNASTWNGGGSGAGWSPFSLAVSFTAQQHGYIVARVVAAKASTTYYIDPPGAGTLT